MRPHILASGPARIKRGLTGGVVGVRFIAAGLVLLLALFLTFTALTLRTLRGFWRSFWRWCSRRRWMRSHILASGAAGVERALACGLVRVSFSAAGLVLNLALFLALGAVTLLAG